VLDDGEFGKSSYAGYMRTRLTGFGGELGGHIRRPQEELEFPDRERRSVPRVAFPRNNGPVTLKDPAGVRRDIANFKAALEGVKHEAAFMPAASPGVVDTFMPTEYCKTDEEYLSAVGDAMRDEYRAIVDAGFILQLECPDVAMSHPSRFVDQDLKQFQDVVRMHIRVVNRAIEGLPREKVPAPPVLGQLGGSAQPRRPAGRHHP
jgi:5-methyltetrahydropteroyltriglutamate--homocysteine methyltransferase